VSYRLGDLDVTDPAVGGTPLFLPDPAMLDAIDVVTETAPPERGGAGPIVTFVPRRPGDSWHGAVGGHVLPAALQAPVPSGPPAIAHYDALGGGRFRVDGPLANGRVGLLVAGSAGRVRRFERDAPAAVEGTEAGLLASLVYTASTRDEVRLLGAFQSASHPYYGRARFGGGDVPEADRFLNLQAAWDRRGATRWAARAGYARGTFTPDLGGRTASGTVERLRDGPVPLLFGGDSARERGVLEAWVEPRPLGALGGQHSLRFGASSAWSRATTRPAEPRGLTAETVDGFPARVWDYGLSGPESRWGAFDFAAWAADRVRWARASLDAGLRFELTRGSAAGAPVDIQWTSVSPRLSARADLTKGGGLALLAGYARYRQRLPLQWLAYGDPSAAQGHVYRWEDRNGNGRLDPGEQGALVAAVGPGGPSASIDPALRPAYTDELVAGLEARLARGWTARLSGIYRREHDLVASVDVGAPRSAYTVTYVPDPGGDLLGPEDDQLLPVYDRRPYSFGQDKYVLTNVDDNVLHQGVEIAVRGAVGRRLQVLFGGTASKTDGPGGNLGFQVTENDAGVVGERLENPNAETDSRGRLFFDRAFTLKLAAIYHAPGDVRAAVVARYQDGQPFARLVIPAGLAQGPDPVQAIPNGRSRFTYTMTVDAHLQKGFQIGRARVAVALELFNLLNTANEVEEDVTTGPQFRAVAAVQPPRAFLLELSAEF